MGLAGAHGCVPHLPVLTHQDMLYLRRLARKTWRYFDDLVGLDTHWLPPDNSQC